MKLLKFVGAQPSESEKDFEDAIAEALEEEASAVDEIIAELTEG